MKRTNDIGQNIAKIRVLRGLSQERFALETGDDVDGDGLSGHADEDDSAGGAEGIKHAGGGFDVAAAFENNIGAPAVGCFLDYLHQILAGDIDGSDGSEGDGQIQFGLLNVRDENSTASARQCSDNSRAPQDVSGT